MHITKQPFKSPMEMFIMEQRELAKNAFKYLKTIGFNKENIQDISKSLCPSFIQCVQKNSIINERIKRKIRDMTLSSKIDSLIYKNDYE